MEERENKKLRTILNYAIIVCIVAILIMIICGIVGKFLDKKTNRIGEFSERHPRLNMVIALALVVIMGTVGYVSIYYIVCKVKEIIHWIADMASKMDAVVIVALITGTVSIIGVIISSIVAKIIDYKKSRQEYLAKKREIPYGEFVEMIYKIQGNIKSEGSYTEKMMMDDLSKFSKQITLWGSSRVVNKWVKFREEGANPNAKSDNLFLMGSGLKTIILVLLNLLIIPQFEKGDKDKIIYAFEELENNLHPALQRRLFDYLYQYSCKHDVMMFLTTHSHIAINAFSEKEKVQILHVMKNNQVSTIQRIDNYFSKSELLNDLDIRASDLLQSNGIVWVEGPSDRVYVKRWIELEGIKFQEGRDYQFMYYGGRLLSHYTMKEADDMINVLMTNRNAAILIDSDKRTKNSRINDTKKRIREEFQSNNMFCWITKGKEIENYIPWKAINKKYPRIDKQCGEYELFPEYIKTVYPGFVQSKVKFAKEICPYITKENSSELLDLQKNIKLLIEQIKKWNKI